MTNPITLPAPVLASLTAMGLIAADDTLKVTELTGGVSSDILLVQTGQRQFCIKRALARLKVAAVWEAPVERNAAEAAWLRTVAQWLPHAVPTLLGEDPALGLFAMTYLAPDAHPVWKRELLAGRVDVDFAGQVGAALARIHAQAAGDAHLAARFANDAIFEPIRIEPYLRATALRHPDLAAVLDQLATRTLATRETLVHGDISPKNILCGPAGPVFLDAECAWYGDPAFDLAFCLNHLLLKSRHRPADQDRLLAAYDALASRYLAGIDPAGRDACEARTASLLPGLLLARIDGKSPVEYLTDESDRAAVRQTARHLLARPVDRLAAVAEQTRPWKHS